MDSDRNVSDLIRRLDSAGVEVAFAGAQGQAAIEELQRRLEVELPPSYVRFLSKYGAGGVDMAPLSGIHGGNLDKVDRGNVLADTLRNRERLALPESYVVVYNPDDEILWCLDCASRSGDGECPVIALDVFGKLPPKVLAADFGIFFETHLRNHAELAEEDAR